MTTPLQSPEYAALVAAKEARDVIYAHKAKVESTMIDAAAQPSVGAVQLLTLAIPVAEAKYKALSADISAEAAQAAFYAAYPAPADVVAAVEAARKYASAQAGWIASFEASLTDGQRDMQAAIKDCQTALDAAVTHAKTLITEAQVSPSKAFVVRKSVKTAVNVEADREVIFEAALNWKLPETLLTIDEAALIKWIEDNPTTAEVYSASVTRAETVTPSVAFYAAKL